MPICKKVRIILSLAYRNRSADIMLKYILADLVFIQIMCRTRIVGYNCYRYIYRNQRNTGHLQHKSKRSAYRNHNRFADELTMTNYNSLPYKRGYRYNRIFEGYERYSEGDVKYFIFESFRTGESLNEKMRIQRMKTLLKKGEYQKANIEKVILPIERDTRMCEIALKQLKRRGQVAPFHGHRRPGQLFKREAI